MVPRQLILTFLLCAAPLAGQDAGHLLVSEEGYAIRPGDRITARLFTAAGDEVNVVSGERIVDIRGVVFLPYVGSVPVAGLSETSLREMLRERYSQFYDQPVVDVTVELRVNVTGSVGSPGQFFLDPTATVMDAMAAAGGVGSELAVVGAQVPADPSRTRLVRDGELLILNLRPEEIQDTVLTMRVRSGDWYHVPSRERSRIRDEITFWGSVISFVSSAVALVILLGR